MTAERLGVYLPTVRWFPFIVKCGSFLHRNVSPSLAETLHFHQTKLDIDNPKGYAAIEGDAREYHPKLRAPVDDRELEIDERTGMKVAFTKLSPPVTHCEQNYMATDGQGWDTSTALIRRTLEQCIRHGQAARGQEGHDLFEAYRLLGTALHTLEGRRQFSDPSRRAAQKFPDLLAHRLTICFSVRRILIFL